MELLNKSVLITGAGGFIGLHVVRLFSENNWEITAVVHKNIPDELKTLNNVKIIQADITDKHVLSQITQQPDVVVHVAGLASDIGSDALFKKINFETVKTFSRLAKIKFIYISSTDVYGIKDFSGEDEDTLPFADKPINPYPKYKIESEKWIRTNLDKNYYVIIRPADVWGEGDKTLESRVVDFLKSSPFIVHFGKWKGKNRWPLADVESVAKAIYVCANTDDFNGEAINIIDEKFTTIDEFYRDIAKKHFPNKRFRTIMLPFWTGYILGIISTSLSNLLKLRQPIFDPSHYAIYHVSSNLDFSCEKMKKVLEYYLTKESCFKKILPDIG
ncbi:MAG: NAD(P)-dependent oxidoreductase [Candidatus Gastranaerophilales bacterium]|nr:NAD(P)-dependent oxidoreductase [Candidatus Gastranaerophilales bacterium]